MDLSSDILDRFRLLAQKQETFRFMNVYRGVSISYEGQVLEVGNTVARLRTHRFQILCMRTETVSYIQSPIFPEVVRGVVVAADARLEQTVMGNFEYVGNSIGNRAQIRVQPRDATRATIINRVGAPAELLEVSLRGMSVHLSPAYFDWRLHRRDTKVVIDLQLPDPSSNRLQAVRMQGLIRNVNVNQTARIIRLGLQTFPDAATEAFLTKYIAQRQAEILKEIRTHFESELQKPG